MKKLLTSVAAASMILVGAFGTASIATAAPVAHNNPVAVTGTDVCNTPGGQEYAKDPVKVYYSFAGPIKSVYYIFNGCLPHK